MLQHTQVTLGIRVGILCLYRQGRVNYTRFNYNYLASANYNYNYFSLGPITITFITITLGGKARKLGNSKFSFIYSCS